MNQVRKTSGRTRTGGISLSTLLVLACALPLVHACAPSASRSPGEHFEGQKIRLIVPFGAGGGYDLHARLLAQRLGKYLPGEPTVFVENMPGAGGLVAAQYFSRQVAPDGLTLGLFSTGLVLHEFVTRDDERALKVGLETFGIVGAPSPDVNVCFFTPRSQIAAYDAWAGATAPPKVGMTGPGSGSFISTLLVAHALELPIHRVAGYQGMAEIKQAMDSGEVDGTCMSHTSFETIFGGVEAYPLAIQTGLERLPGFDGVPLALELAGSQESREILRALAYMRAVGRFYALPPGTPEEVILLVRHAFMNVMSDPDFLRDAEATKLTVDPMSGDEVTSRIVALLRLPEPTRDAIVRILNAGTP